jgi:hypothetical protein
MYLVLFLSLVVDGKHVHGLYAKDSPVILP